MSNTLKTMLSVAAIVAVAAWWYQSFVVEPEQQRKISEAKRAKISQRFTEWAYVAKEKEVAPGETTRLVIVPSPYGHGIIDVKCLIYTNRELKTSSMLCPGADNFNIAEAE